MLRNDLCKNDSFLLVNGTLQLKMFGIFPRGFQTTLAKLKGRENKILYGTSIHAFREHIFI